MDTSRSFKKRNALVFIRLARSNNTLMTISFGKMKTGNWVQTLPTCEATYFAFNSGAREKLIENKT